MEAIARLRNYRVSAQKARLVANEIRGRGVDDALTILDLSTKRFAKPLAKLVRSAVANADEKNNRDHAGIDLDNLVVKAVTVDQGSSMWRIRARAQGRAAWIQHRTSHIQVVLNED
jgi:large subunit ribosomal protein L22